MQLRALNSLFSTDLAVDLGTANTMIYANGRGVVVDEPSVVAVNRNSGAVEAVGKSAKEMLGRTPEGIAAVRPVREGVIADFKMTEQMLLVNRAPGAKATAAAPARNSRRFIPIRLHQFVRALWTGSYPARRSPTCLTGSGLTWRQSSSA